MEEQLKQDYLFDVANEKDNLSLKLTNFEGPLDLLLSLVKENKIEIKDIFVSQVTEQFLSYMSQLAELDVDKASEYMAIAATLIEIKSRALLPVEEEVDENGETPEGILIRQLEEYKMFKEVVGELKTCENVNRFYREPDEHVGEEVYVTAEHLSMDGFMNAFKRILMRMQVRSETENVSHAIVKESFSVTQKVAEIKKRLSESDEVSFFEMFDENASKNEVVTTFIAVLELLKLQMVVVRQKDLFNEIIIAKREGANLDGAEELDYDAIS